MTTAHFKPTTDNRLSAPVGARAVSLGASLAVTATVIVCAAYANLSFLVTNPEHFRFFPPFRASFNANQNGLGGEYYQMARSIVAGQGFANPFKEQTGPTAWMPPVYPIIIAGLLWIVDGSRDAAVTVVRFLQLGVLIVTGLLLVALARQTTPGVGVKLAVAVFLIMLLANFQMCFQSVHDGWLVLLAVDLVFAGLCWCRPLASWQRAACWGVLGGVCAQISPVVGLAWGVLSLVIACQERAWRRAVICMATGALVLAPWTIRNYLVFGRLIPVKSNLAYELYQSQCLQPDGLIQSNTFVSHPHGRAGPEREEYKRLGEIEFLDNKRRLFWKSVANDPLGFAKRVGHRLLGVTVWYVPFDRRLEEERSWLLWLRRLFFALPFLAALGLMIRAIREPLHPVQWIVIGLYFLYLLPYVGVSYYERYGMALLGIKSLLVIWGADAVARG